MNTFNKASKITVTILLLALALSLGACSSSQNSVSPKDDSVTSSPISESETLPAAESQQGGNLSLITDPYGGIFRNGAGTSFGYYEIMSAQNNSLNILYTDYATDIRTYLCADPDCTHNSDTCTSWFSFLGSAYPFTSADGSKIYLVTTGYADNAGSISDEQNYGTIYQFDANGANRKVLYRLQSNEEFYGTAASDGEKLYVSIQVVDSNTSSSHWEVRCLDLSNGESSVIYTTDQYGERIFGAYANNLVIEEVTDTNRSYYTLDVITKQKSAPIYSYNYNDETRTELVNSKYVCFSELFAMERKGGMDEILASTPLGRKYTVKAKLRQSTAVASVIAFGTVLPHLWQVLRDYGLPSLLGPAMSISDLQAVPKFITLSDLLLFWLICRFAACLCMSRITLWLGQKLGNLLPALFISAVSYCLPALLSLSGMRNGIEWLGFYPLFHAAALWQNQGYTADGESYNAMWIPIFLVCAAFFLAWAIGQALIDDYDMIGVPDEVL